MTRTSKTLTALAATAALVVAAVATPQQAEARGRGGAVAAGVIGGLALGAIVGGIASQNRYYYGGPAYAYGPGPVYYRDCYWQRERFWDGWGWRVRRVRVCD